MTTAATAIPTTSVNQGLGFGSGKTLLDIQQRLHKNTLILESVVSISLGTVIPKTNTAASTLFTKPKFDLSQGGLQLGQSALGGGLTLGMCVLKLKECF